MRVFVEFSGRCTWTWYVVLCSCLFYGLPAQTQQVQYDGDIQRVWSTRTIPYVLNRNSFANNEDISNIQEAFSMIEANVCVRFQEGASDEHDFLDIQKVNHGCNTYVGRQGGPQAVHLDDTCLGAGDIAHELIHAMGLWHEHQRMARNSYITIHNDNILGGKRDQFSIKEPIYSFLDAQPYDIDSITHYGEYQYAVNPNSPTIEPLAAAPNMGQRSALSVRDIEKLRLLYNCDVTECISELGQVEHGLPVSTNDRSVGAVVQYECEAGRTMVGADQRQCTLNGTWSGRTPECVSNVLLYCDFEDESLCGWNVPSSLPWLPKWSRLSGRTADPGTGPDTDYSYGTTEGYYLYVDSSDKQPGQTAVLMTPGINQSGLFNISFAYSMVGVNAGQLSLYKLSAFGPIEIWRRDGEQENEWNMAVFGMEANDQEFKMMFKVVLAGGSQGDIAIDRFLVTHT